MSRKVTSCDLLSTRSRFTCLFYMHFWAVESPVTLAQGLKAALDQTNSQR